jgi:hypothetical protein
MPNKQSFFDSISNDTRFNEDFFKKVYGYSIYDDSFLEVVGARLISVGRKDIIHEYNVWLTTWKLKHDNQMKKVARGHIDQLNKQYDQLVKDNKAKKVDECKQREIELLQQKKMLLLMKRSKQLNGSLSN